MQDQQLMIDFDSNSTLSGVDEDLKANLWEIDDKRNWKVRDRIWDTCHEILLYYQLCDQLLTNFPVIC